MNDEMGRLCVATHAQCQALGSHFLRGTEKKKATRVDVFPDRDLKVEPLENQ